MASQGNKNAGPSEQPAKQQQPTLHAAKGKDCQANPSNDQRESSSRTPTGNASLERSPWWADSNWWLVIIAALPGSPIVLQSWETQRYLVKSSLCSLLSKIRGSAMNTQTNWLLAKERPQFGIRLE
jgi:hypothetical protein